MVVTSDMTLKTGLIAEYISLRTLCDGSEKVDECLHSKQMLN
jgi:hypothetical protein